MAFITNMTYVHLETDRTHFLITGIYMNLLVRVL